MAVSAFVVEAKQNSLKRQRVAEKSRMYNKSRKSEIATRMKKVGAGQPPGAESRQRLHACWRFWGLSLRQLRQAGTVARP